MRPRRSFSEAFATGETTYLAEVSQNDDDITVQFYGPFLGEQALAFAREHPSIGRTDAGYSAVHVVSAGTALSPLDYEDEED